MYAHVFIAVLDEMPRLYDLHRLCRGSTVVNVIRAVAPSWEMFAVHLHMEEHMIAVLKRNAPNQAEEATRTLFSHWLNGNGRQPISWKTLIQALHEYDLSMIATEVEEILTGHSGELSRYKSLAMYRYCNKSKTHTYFTMLTYYTLSLCVCVCACVHAVSHTQCVHVLTALLIGSYRICKSTIMIKF
jgi:hypothetical protein